MKKLANKCFNANAIKNNTSNKINTGRSMKSNELKYSNKSLKVCNLKYNSKSFKLHDTSIVGIKNKKPKYNHFNIYGSRDKLKFSTRNIFYKNTLSSITKYIFRCPSKRKYFSSFPLVSEYERKLILNSDHDLFIKVVYDRPYHENINEHVMEIIKNAAKHADLFDLYLRQSPSEKHLAYKSFEYYIYNNLLDMNATILVTVISKHETLESKVINSILYVFCIPVTLMSMLLLGFKIGALIG